MLDVLHNPTMLEQLKALPQVECPLEHHFSDGIYLRQITMPAGIFVLGKKHKTRHLNVVLKGVVEIRTGENEVATITAPCTFESFEGVQKTLHIIEECVWQTIHLNPENIEDIPTLEDRLVCTEIVVGGQE